MTDIPDLVTQNAFYGVDSVDTTRGLLSERAVTGNLLQRAGDELPATVKICTSFSDVSKALNIDASASASFLGDSVSAKMSFAQKLDVTDTSVVIIANARKIDSVWTSSGVTLLSDAPSQQSISDFTHHFGDSYVDSVSLGWEYCGAYVFHASTTDEQKSITASLAANGVIDGVSASASVQTTIVNTSKTTNTTVTAAWTFIGFQPASPPSQKDVITPALDFMAANLVNPAVLARSTVGYETLDPLNTLFQPVAKNRLYFVGDIDNTGLLAQLEKIRAKRDVITAMQGSTLGAMMGNLIPFLTQAIADVNHQLAEYKSDPTQIFSTIANIDALTSDPTVFSSLIPLPGP